jgi:hypothetical protein
MTISAVLDELSVASWLPPTTHDRFFPRERTLAVLRAYAWRRPFGRRSSDFLLYAPSELPEALTYIWCSDVLEGACYRLPWIDALPLLVKCAPQVWYDLFCELLAYEMTWSLHSDSPSPHSNLFHRLDAMHLEG